MAATPNLKLDVRIVSSAIVTEGMDENSKRLPRVKRIVVKVAPPETLDGDKMRLLAEWLDHRYGTTDGDVQQDLRRIANRLDLLDEIEGELNA